jgi:AcrR family transcriptional regulator
MPGRPREAHIDEAVLSATVALLSEMSYARLSVELVARKARVGKAAVYRRWPSKAALVADAVGRFAPIPQFPEDGDLAENTRAGLVGFALAMMGSGYAHVVYSLLGEARNEPELARMLAESYMGPRKVIPEALRRCMDAGVIRDDISRAAAQSLLLGPLLHGWALTGIPPDQDFIDEVVTTAWAALQARPHPAPSKRQPGKQDRHSRKREEP